MVLGFALGGAALIGTAEAASRQGDEGQFMVATSLLAPTQITVALPARRAAVADPNLDGIVSRMEAARYYEARFALFDRDRDGRVSRPELLGPAAARSWHARGKTRAVPFGHDAVHTDRAGTFAPSSLLGTNDRGAWPAAGADARRAAIFDLLDADRDGALSRQEFIDTGAGDFGTSDADGDSQVTTREFYAGKRL